MDAEGPKSEGSAIGPSGEPLIDPSGSGQGIRAWLFQFTPGEHFAEWRLNPKADRDPGWPVGRYGPEIQLGDLVFFWQRGMEEGLRGYGVVAGERRPSTVEGREGDEIEVTERLWQRTIAPKAALLASGSIDHFNLIANGSEPNLRLNPAEATSLGSILAGPDFPAYSVVWHAPGQRWAGHSPMRQLLVSLEIEDATPLAEHVLDAALGEGQYAGRLLTTSRLLLSLARPFSVSASNSMEMQCVSAVELGINAHSNLMSAIARERNNNRAPPLSDAEVADAVFALRRAYALSVRTHKRRVLSADAIAAALVTEGGASLIEMLGRMGETLENLIANITEAANRISPDVSKRWAVLTAPVRLLEPEGGVSAPAAPTPPPLVEPNSPVSPSMPQSKSDPFEQTAAPPPTPQMGPSDEVLGDEPPHGPPPPSPHPQAPPPPAWLGISVAAPRNDDPWGKNLDDKLGVRDEARAFARLALSTDFRPPLAVGVFGEWGAGKSFFMRLMYEHVERLDTGKPSEEAPEAGQPNFHRNIVQIRFNAWHYVDTNLWASLVDHIFTELDRWAHVKDKTQAEGLFENLATARELTLDAAARLVRRREQQKVASEQLAKAERELEEAKRPTIVAYWEALTQLAESNPSIRGQRMLFDKAADELGLPQIEKDTVALQAAVGAMGDEAARAKLLASGLKAQLGSWRTVVFFLVGCIALPALLFLARDALLAFTHLQFFKELHGGILGAAGALATLAGLFGRATARARKYVDTLGNAKESLDAALRAQSAKPAAVMLKQQNVLAQRAGDVAEARATLAASSDRLAEAAREYSTGTGRGRLLRFVRDKVSGGDYAKHLGLVATVRKDFEELASNMQLSAAEPVMGTEQRERIDQHKQQVEALIASAADGSLLSEAEIMKLRESGGDPPQDPKAAFERIILYIDDLDRCPPDKVVEVLQAVHLLLTFSLFVVVVAVDVRWVSRALERYYPDLLDGASEDAMSRTAASAHDYLEKIFQIPYWVRPMNDASSIEFLAARAGDVVLAKTVTKAAASGDVGALNEQMEVARHANEPPRLDELEEPPSYDSSLASLSSPNAANADRDDAVKPQRVALDKLADDLAAASTKQQAAGALAVQSNAQSKTDPAQGKNATRTLLIEKPEEVYMKLLAPYVGGSPRRALRFLNVYRVIKASLGPAETVLLADHGGYRALMTQLAIATGSPSLLNGWLTMLVAAPKGAAIGDLRASLGKEYWFLTSPEHVRLDGALTVFERASHGTAQLEALQRYAALARRYSFTG